MKNWLLVSSALLCTFFLFSFSGCGVVLNGSTQLISIRSTPPGSTVDIEGETYTTPAEAELERNQNYIVTISKEGYETRQVRIRKKVDVGVVVLDFLFLFGGLAVDYVVGSLYDLYPDRINVTLTSKQTGAVDIPVKIVPSGDASVKFVSTQPVQIKIEKIKKGE